MLEAIYNTVLNWVLKPELLVGWLQATAAVTALGISVWAVRAPGAEQRRLRVQEIEALVLAL